MSNSKNVNSMRDYSSFKMNVVRMSPKKFMELSPYNRNRFVEGRVSKMVKRLSKGPLPTHLIVAVCKVTKNFGPYKKDQMFRLDGHTRTDSWKVNPELIPNVDLIAIVYEIGSKEDCKRVYDDIDSTESAETANEKVTGLLNERNYTPKSQRFKKGTFKTAVINACRYIHTPEGVYLNGKEFNDKFDVKLDYLWNEFLFIDNMGIDDFERYSGNLLTSLFLLSKKYGTNNNRLKTLINNYREGITTTSTSTHVDGVHFVYNILYPEYQNVWTQTGFSNSFLIISKILYSLDMFMNDKLIGKNKKKQLPSDNELREFYQDFIK